MKCRKVRRYALPEYPTHVYLRDHPELLRWVPQRGKSNRLVLSVLGMVLPLLIARQAAAGEAGDPPAAPLRVAPLFIHGDGRGSFGCVAVNPPVFFSEDEARQVVQDEARKAGIVFDPNGLTLKNVSLPVTDPFDFLDEKERGQRKDGGKNQSTTKTGDLVLDGVDRTRNVAYEFVSKEDFAAWERQDQSVWCSVSSYDLKTTASKLAGGLTNATGKTVVALFYEPGAAAPEMEYPNAGATEEDWRTHWQLRQQAGKKLGEEELRQQVRDFLEWLKAQGII